MDRNERLVGIELLRFTAALAVLVWHFQNFWLPGSATEVFSRSAQPYAWLLAPFYLYGQAGVQLFWCISGFIFTWKYQVPIHERNVSFGRFAWWRLSRLYPLHLATLLIVAGLNTVYFWHHGEYFVYQTNNLKHFLLQLAFASQWGFQDDNSFNGPVWSVSVEIPVYLLFFFLTRRWRGSFWTDAAVVVLASIAYQTLRQGAHVKLEIFGAITFFYLGAATYRLWVWALADAVRQRWTTWSAAVAVMAMCAAVALHVLKMAGAGLAMFPAAILFVQLAVRPASRSAAKTMEFIGNLTYASYMTHFPLQIAMVLGFEAMGARLADYFATWWLLPLYLGIVMVLAPAVYFGFERPAQAWMRRRFVQEMVTPLSTG